MYQSGVNFITEPELDTHIVCKFFPLRNNLADFSDGCFCLLFLIDSLPDGA